MRINGVQNYSYAQSRVKQNNQAFEARFDKASLKLLLDEASHIKKNKPEIIPQLYTMLSYIKELPGKVVKFVDKSEGKYVAEMLQPLHRSLVVDNEKVLLTKSGSWLKTSRGHVKTLPPKALEMLEQVCLLDEKNLPTHPYVRMPKSVFEQEWWKNRGVSEQTIVNRFEY